MLLSVVAAALVGAMPCNLSLLAPAAAPARLQASAPANRLQPDCDGLSARPVSTGGRRALSVLAGVFGSAIGAVAGATLGYAAAERCDNCTFGPEEFWIGALIGLQVGAGLGAHLGGSLTGGRGTWTGTILGTLGGGLLGVLMTVLIGSLESSDANLLLVVPLLMPTAGAVTGYALSEPDAPGPCASPEQSPRAPMLRLRFSF
jgi:hypothetical protein